MTRFGSTRFLEPPRCRAARLKSTEFRHTPRGGAPQAALEMLKSPVAERPPGRRPEGLFTFR